MSVTKKLSLKVLPGRFVVAQFPPGTQIPSIFSGADLIAEIRTPEEVTLICLEEKVPEGAKTEPGWRVIKVIGPLDFALVGILAELAGLLADAGISIFALSTFDTDYILVKSERLAGAQAALTQAGHQFL